MKFLVNDEDGIRSLFEVCYIANVVDYLQSITLDTINKIITTDKTFKVSPHQREIVHASIPTSIKLAIIAQLHYKKDNQYVVGRINLSKNESTGDEVIPVD